MCFPMRFHLSKIDSLNLAFCLIFIQLDASLKKAGSLQSKIRENRVLIDTPLHLEFPEEVEDYPKDAADAVRAVRG